MKGKNELEILSYVLLIILAPMFFTFSLEICTTVEFYWRPLIISIYTTLASIGLYMVRIKMDFKQKIQKITDKEDQAKKLEIEIAKIDNSFSDYESIPLKELERRTRLQKERDYILFGIEEIEI